MKRLLIPVFVALATFALPILSQKPEDLPQRMPRGTPAELLAFQDKPKADDPVKPKPGTHGRGHILPSKELRDALHRVSEAKYGYIRKALPVITDKVYDARIKGIVPPTGDQDGCGDCYVWSGCKVCASAQMAAKVVPQDGKFMLAPSYFLDCQNVGGCGGGDEYQVAQIIQSSGAPSLAAYGGDGASPGRCKPTTGMTLYTVSNLIMVGTQSGIASTQDIKNYCAAYGYVSVAGAAGNDWDNLGANGTITGNSTDVNHAIGIVGWDDGHDNGDGSKGAWIMANQWGTSWGGTCANSLNTTPAEAGYAWVKYGADSLGTEAFVAVAGSGPVPPTPPGPIPPTPPTPPGPPLPGTTSLTLSTALPAGTYYLSTVPITGETKLSDIMGILNPPTPGPVPPSTDHQLLDAIRKILAEQAAKEKKP